MRNPDVPESLESWWILHRMFDFDRLAWDRLDKNEQQEIAREAHQALDSLKKDENADLSLAQLVGHKGDLMLTHYSKDYDGLAHAQTTFNKTRLTQYLKPAGSYVSILELGLYDATGKIHTTLQERGLKPYTPEWTEAFDELLKEQEKNPRHAGRLWAPVPQRRYVCFYPMDKKRGEEVSWYTLPFEERGKLMLDHGKIGRKYHGLVTQVISGSIGCPSVIVTGGKDVGVGKIGVGAGVDVGGSAVGLTSRHKTNSSCPKDPSLSDIANSKAY